jgi:hypothetical protein
MYAKHRTKRALHLDPIEGGHRRLAAIQTFLCGPIAGKDGTIMEQTDKDKRLKIHHMFSPKDFEDVGIINKERGRLEKKRDIDERTEAIIGNALFISKTEADCEFYQERSHVTVYYLSNNIITVPEFLKACRSVSMGLANQKRESATKDPITEVGSEICSILKLMTDDSLQYRPVLHKLRWKKKGEFPAIMPKVDLEKAIKDNELAHTDGQYVISEVLENADFLHETVVEEYCRNPMDPSNLKAMRQKLAGTTKNHEGNEIEIHPPYLLVGQLRYSVTISRLVKIKLSYQNNELRPFRRQNRTQRPRFGLVAYS